MYRSTYNKGFVVTVALLPAVVQLVIMLVNGNLGVGLAVMGAFTLVRFRSIPGSSRDITAIFLSMAVGLATGMGFLGIAALFVVVMGAATLIYTRIPFGEPADTHRQLRITVPETLNFAGEFDDILKRYTTTHKLTNVKTVNMGSLYRLQYQLTLKKDSNQQAFIDELRTRNGNLEVALGIMPTRSEEL
jgi:hypothetical protein